jgi:hypothetical protein
MTEPRFRAAPGLDRDEGMISFASGEDSNKGIISICQIEQKTDPQTGRRERKGFPREEGLLSIS